MTATDTQARVVDILVDVLMIDDPARVTPTAHLVRDLGAESINVAEITIALEDEFGIPVAGTDLQKAATVESLVALVDGLRAQHAS